MEEHNYNQDQSENSNTKLKRPLDSDTDDDKSYLSELVKKQKTSDGIQVQQQSFLPSYPQILDYSNPNYRSQLNSFAHQYYQPQPYPQLNQLKEQPSLPMYQYKNYDLSDGQVYPHQQHQNYDYNRPYPMYPYYQPPPMGSFTDNGIQNAEGERQIGFQKSAEQKQKSIQEKQPIQEKEPTPEPESQSKETREPLIFKPVTVMQNILDPKPNTSSKDKMRELQEEATAVQIASNIDPNKVFATIPGRLTLLTKQKYDVTVGELIRRVDAPECLNTSLIGSIIRTAKRKNGGDDLRDRLAEVGIKLPSHRRKDCQQTTFTSLIEAEAAQMVQDFDLICKKNFNTEECAKYILNSNEGNPECNNQQFVLQVKKFLDLFKTFLNKKPRVSGQKEDNMHRLMMLTHNFAIPAMLVTVRVMQDVVKKALEG